MKVRAVKFPTQSFVRTITPLHTHLLRVVARLLCRVLPRRAPTTNHPTTNHHTSFAIKSGPPPSSGHTSLLNFQSYSAPPVTPRAGLPRPFSTAPPCPPPNTPPHACRVVQVRADPHPAHLLNRAPPGLSLHGTCLWLSLVSHPTVSSLSQSFAHTRTHTLLSPSLRTLNLP